MYLPLRSPFDWCDEALGLNWLGFAFAIMGPGRSSSLRIGDDSLVVAGSGWARDDASRSAVVEPQNVAGAPPLP